MTHKKILLALLPFWTPLIPPQGISRIKGFLQEHGYPAKTVDVNLVYEFKKLYDSYFETLRKYIPEHNQGNIYNIGNDVWRDHMMAHINYDDEDKYLQLVKLLVYNVFYWELQDQQVVELNGILTQFYSALERYFLELLEQEKPDVLGLSVYRDTLAPSLFVFRLAKQKYPGIMTVMGGSIFSVQLTLNSPNLEFFMEKTGGIIDKFIVGEGELIFLKILRGKLPREQRLFTKKDIEGETLGFTSIRMFDFSDFSPRDYPYAAAQGSSSCPNDCCFCNVASFYGNYREKDPAQTVEEMIYLHKKYKCQLFFMLDSLLNGVATGIANEVIKRDISLYWDGYYRIDDACTREKALLWRRGGFYRARIGVESGSQRLLDLMDKGITVPQIRENISNLAYAGIKTTAYIVIGHPGETEQDFQQTLDLLEELKDDIWEAECNPFFYIYSGQAGNKEWADKRMLLYPSWAKDMLISQTWIVDGDPAREIFFQRIYRFVQHCKKLGISTPWSMQGVNKVDQRWKRLHKNAVPPLLDLLKKTGYIDEHKHVKEIIPAKITVQDEDDFEFEESI